MILSSSVQIQSPLEVGKNLGKTRKGIIQVGFGQCDQIGQNFAYFLLNQFSPNQALSSRDQETP
jgi:hypothetical protein